MAVAAVPALDGAVELSPADEPSAFTWHGVHYEVRVIGRWHLADRLYASAAHSDRRYFRVVTSDHQVFELYEDLAQRPPPCSSPDPLGLSSHTREPPWPETHEERCAGARRPVCGYNRER